jgi:hypothetical protein
VIRFRVWLKSERVIRQVFEDRVYAVFVRLKEVEEDVF